MMELARVIYRDIPWYLSDGPLINPEVGTIVQVTAYTNENGDWGYAVYFPGSQAPCIISHLLFKLYFEWLE